MSNDLISRSALMQSLRNNVLVDVTPNLEQAIEEQPTAYDVDKVVGRLEQDSQNIELIYPTDQWYEYEEAIGIDINKAKEIVKSGGIQYPDSSNTDTENITANWKEHLAGRFNRFE